MDENEQTQAEYLFAVMFSITDHPFRTSSGRWAVHFFSVVTLKKNWRLETT
jgi:hypothetical protein